jgi:hypothetical protein
MMEGSCVIILVTGLKRHNTGKDDYDNDEDQIQYLIYIFSYSHIEYVCS